MKKRNITLTIGAVVLASVLVLSYFLFINKTETVNSEVAVATNKGELILDVTTDKAMYDPGDKIELKVSFKNQLKQDLKNGKMEIKIKHLEKQVGSTIEKEISIDSNKTTVVTEQLEMPDTDFKGYLIEVDVKNNEKKLVDSATVGVDVSSSWTKFPRYGYVWDFRKGVDTTSRIEKLKDYHINALEYYDWKYRHHMPVGENTEVWDDWSGRAIYGETIRNYIADAKDVNMVNMAYNMIYAATNGYEEDGVKQEWALYHAEGDSVGKHFKFQMSDSTPTGITHLYFFDPSNKEWQEYIFEQTNKVFEVFDFDGWHGDTVGEWGKMKTHDGEIVYVKDTYTEFLNAAKEAIGDKYLSFNPVGAQGIENANKSDVDVLYVEIWPWDSDSEGLKYDSYYSLKKEIDKSREESGGKSLVVKAYMSYDYGEQHPGMFFNTSAVLLADAAVYAAGGSRLELGDNGSMLSNEYYPAENLFMKQELKDRIATYYDFIVAYENLLRDGQENTDNRIEFPDYANSGVAVPNKIWAYGKQDSEYEIIQMINLLGVSSDDWRANEGKKETPKKITDFEVKYYYTNEINSVWLASPDRNDGRTQELSFTKGSDENGDYIQITVPSLEYWNMIYMK
ncbi:glycoside hydrolase family 66 protein [Lederbergia graminis]|uniref:Glycoside hydrolase family 66 protein n=1 Tax=Lederbergia graminis TaxID=735518 RepID=A0ABW0LHU2_9BACI